MQWRKAHWSEEVKSLCLTFRWLNLYCAKCKVWWRVYGVGMFFMGWAWSSSQGTLAITYKDFFPYISFFQHFEKGNLGISPACSDIND